MRRLRNPNFGSVVVPSATFDPNLRSGWGKRQYNWEFSLGVQRELRPRVSVELSYFRRWYGNFQVSNDTAYSAADFDVVSITAPSDPDLPGGGGFTIPGVYNLKPAVALEGRPDHYVVTLADRYGKQTEHWNGVDVLANARLPNSVSVQGRRSGLFPLRRWDTVTETRDSSHKSKASALTRFRESTCRWPVRSRACPDVSSSRFTMPWDRVSAFCLYRGSISSQYRSWSRVRSSVIA